METLQETNNTKAITEAVRRVFPSLPDTFFATTLIKEVRDMTQTRGFDGTIMRMARRLKQKDPKVYGFTCIDNKRSIYTKVRQN